MRYDEAFTDATELIKHLPKNELSYNTRGIVFEKRNLPDSALVSYNKCLSLKPDLDFALNNRGSILVNIYKQYSEALVDFNKAIQINPQGNYHLNRSICYYKLNEFEKARSDAQTAIQKGSIVSDSYKALLKIP